MGRPLRAAEGGYVYHVLNRANARMTIFDDPDDFAAFEQVLSQAVERSQTRLLAYCLMPNHSHLTSRAPSAASALAGGSWRGQDFLRAYVLGPRRRQQGKQVGHIGH